MTDHRSRILIDVAYAVGAAGPGANAGAGEVLDLLAPVTHHDAAALYAWDGDEHHHRLLAGVGYDDRALIALGDRYADSAENRALRVADGPLRIDDMPFDYRTTCTYQEVLHPAGFTDGMTCALHGDDGKYLGLFHVSAESSRTFDDNARDLVGALTSVMGRLCSPHPIGALRPASDREDARASLIRGNGQVYPIAGFHSARTCLQPTFASVVRQFHGTGFTVRTGLWPLGVEWLTVTLSRVADPMDRLSTAVLVQEHPTTVPHNLSERELDILSGIALGQANQHIATRRNISVRTVTSHVENILRKMGQESRTGAAVTASHAGLLRLDDPSSLSDTNRPEGVDTSRESQALADKAIRSESENGANVLPAVEGLPASR